MKDEDTLDSVEQRLMHGLLSDLHGSRIAAAPPRRSWLPRTAAAAAFLTVGLLAGLFMQARLPEAGAVLDRASRESRTVTDRQYSVVVTALKQPKSERIATGTLHVRGAEAFAIRFDAVFGKGWHGSDGRTTWLDSGKGERLSWPAGEASRSKDADKLAWVQFDSFLRTHRDRYDVLTVGREHGLLHVRATRKLDVPGESISQFDVWVSEESGVMKRLHYRMDPELWHWEPWLVSVEHRGEETHPADYYSPDSKSRGSD